MMVAALILAESIAAMSPFGVRNMKLNLNFDRDNKLEESLDFAVSLFLESRGWWQETLF